MLQMSDISNIDDVVDLIVDTLGIREDGTWRERDKQQAIYELRKNFILTGKALLSVRPESLRLLNIPLLLRIELERIVQLNVPYQPELPLNGYAHMNHGSYNHAFHRPMRETTFHRSNRDTNPRSTRITSHHRSNAKSNQSTRDPIHRSSSRDVTSHHRNSRDSSLSQYSDRSKSSLKGTPTSSLRFTPNTNIKATNKPINNVPPPRNNPKPLQPHSSVNFRNSPAYPTMNKRTHRPCSRPSNKRPIDRSDDNQGMTSLSDNSERLFSRENNMPIDLATYYNQNDASQHSYHDIQQAEAAHYFQQLDHQYYHNNSQNQNNNHEVVYNPEFQHQQHPTFNEEIVDHHQQQPEIFQYYNIHDGHGNDGHDHGADIHEPEFDVNMSIREPEKPVHIHNDDDSDDDDDNDDGYEVEKVNHETLHGISIEKKDFKLKQEVVEQLGIDHQHQQQQQNQQQQKIVDKTKPVKEDFVSFSSIAKSLISSLHNTKTEESTKQQPSSKIPFSASSPSSLPSSLPSSSSSSTLSSSLPSSPSSLPTTQKSSAIPYFDSSIPLKPTTSYAVNSSRVRSKSSSSPVIPSVSQVVPLPSSLLEKDKSKNNYTNNNNNKQQQQQQDLYQAPSFGMMSSAVSPIGSQIFSGRSYMKKFVHKKGPVKMLTPQQHSAPSSPKRPVQTNDHPRSTSEPVVPSIPHNSDKRTHPIQQQNNKHPTTTTTSTAKGNMNNKVDKDNMEFPIDIMLPHASKVQHNIYSSSSINVDLIKKEEMKNNNNISNNNNNKIQHSFSYLSSKKSKSRKYDTSKEYEDDDDDDDDDVDNEDEDDDNDMDKVSPMQTPTSKEKDSPVMITKTPSLERSYFFKALTGQSSPKEDSKKESTSHRQSSTSSTSESISITESFDDILKEEWSSLLNNYNNTTAASTTTTTTTTAITPTATATVTATATATSNLAVANPIITNDTSNTIKSNAERPTQITTDITVIEDNGTNTAVNVDIDISSSSATNVLFVDVIPEDDDYKNDSKEIQPPEISNITTNAQTINRLPNEPVTLLTKESDEVLDVNTSSEQTAHSSTTNNDIPTPSETVGVNEVVSDDKVVMSPTTTTTDVNQSLPQEDSSNQIDDNNEAAIARLKNKIKQKHYQLSNSQAKLELEEEKLRMLNLLLRSVSKKDEDAKATIEQSARKIEKTKNRIKALSIDEENLQTSKSLIENQLNATQLELKFVLEHKDSKEILSPSSSSLSSSSLSSTPSSLKKKGKKASSKKKRLSLTPAHSGSLHKLIKDNEKNKHHEDKEDVVVKVGGVGGEGGGGVKEKEEEVNKDVTHNNKENVNDDEEVSSSGDEIIVKSRRLKHKSMTLNYKNRSKKVSPSTSSSSKKEKNKNSEGTTTTTTTQELFESKLEVPEWSVHSSSESGITAGSKEKKADRSKSKDKKSKHSSNTSSASTSSLGGYSESSNQLSSLNPTDKSNTETSDSTSKPKIELEIVHEVDVDHKGDKISSSQKRAMYKMSSGAKPDHKLQVKASSVIKSQSLSASSSSTSTPPTTTKSKQITQTDDDIQTTSPRSGSKNTLSVTSTPVRRITHSKTLSNSSKTPKRDKHS
eukprot:TRINITY_DN3002_c0_g1_i1.p1 TRINITY_DN3002_c0_g1~~TRINITY_DN3002_c0_g1_i1.p1  ORF type:complete len:1582 (+),score=583.97 TRINITY_DN3002_c0_g1_i1:67-4812(+)